MIPQFKYDDVSEVEFLTYIENIKRQLQKEAPEWEVHVQHTPDNIILHHLARWDFTKGKDQTWAVHLYPWVFAYEQILYKETVEKKFFLLNKHPIEKK